MKRMVVNGQPFEDFTRASVQKSIDSMAGSFSFQATWDEGQPFPIPRAASVQIYINDQQIIDGYVERINPQISVGGGSIEISGRDKTSDLIDSSLPANAVQVVAGISFEEVIRRGIAAIGSNVGVINNVQGLEPFGSADVISNEAGENLYSFLDTLAKKKQVLLTTDGAGNIVITRSSSQQINFELRNLDNDEQNTITVSSVSIDDSNRFHTYAVVTQGNVTGLTLSGGSFSPGDVANTSSVMVTDSEIRAGRTLYLNADENMSSADCTALAQWEANIRKARSRSYSCTVDGHSDNDGQIFRPNMLVPVMDSSVNVFETMLISSCSYEESVDGGDVTYLELVHKDSYTLQLTEPQSQKNAETFWE